ncbi:hypothetical protein MRB53_037847 [Persea americana]|nr:hypothetical protein MRB53_037847 [Persea americana]
MSIMSTLKATTALIFLALSSVDAIRTPLVARQSQQGNSKQCPANTPYSCQNTTAVQDLCCFNAPGGALLQTQFWDANPASGPSDSWTIHGFWPDFCDGTYSANCDDDRAYTNITQILQSFGEDDLLQYMKNFWTSNTGSAEDFWQHEFSKHGTCISTLDPSCYTNYKPTEEAVDFFAKTVSTFKTLPTYKWLSDAGITPSSSQTYSLSSIQSALSKNRGGHSVYIGCASGAIDEVWYFFNVRGSFQDGDFEAVDALSNSNCPSSVKYLPKSASSSPTSTTSSAKSTSTSGSGSGSFSGSGYLNVVSGGKQNGCVISSGVWYTSGTCATYTASASGSGFTLKSSKGLCAVSNGALTCSSSVSSGTVFTANGNTLQYKSSSAFSSDSTPSGNQQATVYSGSSHSVGLTIQWQSK